MPIRARSLSSLILIGILNLMVVMTSPARGQVPLTAAAGDNPLLREWTTPFGVPPFGAIAPGHFVPAFKAAIAQHRRDVEAIAASPDPPTFANTFEALENAGALLTRIGPVLSNLVSSDAGPELQAINAEIAPMLTALRDDVRLDPRLFQRVRTLWEERDRLSLTPVQRRLVEESHKDFIRGGANLSSADKERFRAINAELTRLGITFGDNLLHDTNAWRLVIDRESDLAGLPPAVVASGAAAAKAAGMEGKWIYTLQAPSIWPFLQHAENRELRRQILTAYVTRCDHGDAHDTKAIVARLAVLRTERAQLLGYKTHAEFVLAENMAKTPDTVYALLHQLWAPARARAIEEAADQQELMARTDPSLTLEPWDWRYYTEQILKTRYALDEQALRPYFALDRVRQGAFLVASRLYGLTFTPRPDLPVYHPDVQAFEVKDREGRHVGVYYSDDHPRPGKRVGAWSSGFRSGRLRDGQWITPVVVNVCNFSPSTGETPSLLSLEEVETLFHEFGHALSALLSTVPYPTLARTPRDFVELPSQIMENWAMEPEVLRLYARHYQTGETIPVETVEKIKRAEQFNQGFITVEYLAASFLDMDWHTLETTEPQDPVAFERTSLARIQLPPEIVSRYKSPYFNHVFGPGGGYSAGYYSYIWSEVLDQDAFQAFRENGLFDPATAKAFQTLLAKGGTEEPMALYKAFRGREPSVEPLLRKRGLK